MWQQVFTLGYMRTPNTNWLNIILLRDTTEIRKCRVYGVIVRFFTFDAPALGSILPMLVRHIVVGCSPCHPKVRVIGIGFSTLSARCDDRGRGLRCYRCWHDQLNEAIWQSTWQMSVTGQPTRRRRGALTPRSLPALRVSLLLDGRRGLDAARWVFRWQSGGIEVEDGESMLGRWRGLDIVVDRRASTWEILCGVLHMEVVQPHGKDGVVRLAHGGVENELIGAGNEAETHHTGTRFSDCFILACSHYPPSLIRSNDEKIGLHPSGEGRGACGWAEASRINSNEAVDGEKRIAEPNRDNDHVCCCCSNSHHRLSSFKVNVSF